MKRRPWVREGLLLLALAFVPGVGQAIYFRDRISWRAPVAASDQVTLAQAQAWGDATMWIDARPAEDFEHEHIPGAVLLNEDRWNDLLPQVLAVWSPEKRVVVYCSSHSCGASRAVARRLREEGGLKNVFVLDGGWESWTGRKQ